MNDNENMDDMENDEENEDSEEYESNNTFTATQSTNNNMRLTNQNNISVNRRKLNFANRILRFYDFLKPICMTLINTSSGIYESHANWL